jgi:hypothetical protein
MLADLDRDASVNAVDRLDLLYELRYQITGRVLEMESAEESTGDVGASKWRPVRH